MFADIEILYFGSPILALLLLLLFFSEKSKKRRLSRLISPKLVANLIPNHSKARRNIKFGLFSLSFLLMVVGLSRPQWGITKRQISPSGIDILIAVDISKSMLARDIKPNRLERVKLGLQNSLEKVKADRLGLIAFSGSSFLQCPLTLDHQAFNKTIKDLEVGLIKTPGTNLALPIDEASRSFAKDDNDKFLVILSDGEDLESEGLRRAKIAKEEGIKIFTIGIGSKSGSFISTDPYDSPAKNFLKDREGKTIVSKMDENALKAIAEVTGGQYFQLGPTGEGLARTFEILKKIGVEKRRDFLASGLPTERYQIFILIAFFLILIEFITPSSRKEFRKLSIRILPFFLLISCLKQENVKQAEMEMENGNASEAARLYSLEINASEEGSKPVDPKLYLNAGLSHLQAGMHTKAEKFLNMSLEHSLESPSLQSMALNALGNIYYKKTSDFLGIQNIQEAKKAWQKAFNFYNSALELDGNANAKANIQLLNGQIEQKIKSLITTIRGKVWRDIDGDGMIQQNEPPLRGFVFWDKDNNGEFNATSEPRVDTNENGDFLFEWISSTYPAQIHIGSILTDKNLTNSEFLIPLFPPPPPPLSSSTIKNHTISLSKADSKVILIPYRSAPTIRGEIWSDDNANGIKDSSEKGYTGAKIFIDTDGNFELNENESSFSPFPDGSFKIPVNQGQHSVCITLENKDANITFPLDENKAYLTWADFETESDNLIFGVADEKNNQSDPENSQSENTSQQNDEAKGKDKEKKENSTEKLPQEVNALYERLLQEMESKSQPLDRNIGQINILNNGRDY